MTGNAWPGAARRCGDLDIIDIGDDFDITHTNTAGYADPVGGGRSPCYGHPMTGNAWPGEDGGGRAITRQRREQSAGTGT